MIWQRWTLKNWRITWQNTEFFLHWKNMDWLSQRKVPNDYFLQCWYILVKKYANQIFNSKFLCKNETSSTVILVRQQVIWKLNLFQKNIFYVKLHDIVLNFEIGLEQCVFFLLQLIFAVLCGVFNTVSPFHHWMNFVSHIS